MIAVCYKTQVISAHDNDIIKHNHYIRTIGLAKLDTKVSTNTMLTYITCIHAINFVYDGYIAATMTHTSVLSNLQNRGIL